MDHDTCVDHLSEHNAAMEDPVWIHLPAFIKALFARDAIEVVDEVDYKHPMDPRHLDKMRPLTDISQDRLEIVDSFTIQAGMLALPRLARRFADLFPTGTFDISQF